MTLIGYNGMQTGAATRVSLLLCLFAFISGCANQSVTESPATNETLDAKPLVQMPRNTEPMRMILGESVKKRPIEMLVFGEGPINVLILGGIHGDEPTSVDLTRGLVEILKANPSLYAGRKVAIIPIANPDGFAQRSRFNARRVDVNRNFPARNFDASQGRPPVSEPETRAILSALESTRPHLIISIHSISRGRQCNNFDGPADGIASVMSRYNGYPPKASIGYPTPGSMGSYCGGDLQIPMITLELPKDLPGEEAWETNRDALLTAIRAAR